MHKNVDEDDRYWNNKEGRKERKIGGGTTTLEHLTSYKKVGRNKAFEILFPSPRLVGTGKSIIREVKPWISSVILQPMISPSWWETRDLGDRTHVISLEGGYRVFTATWQQREWRRKGEHKDQSSQKVDYRDQFLSSVCESVNRKITQWLRLLEESETIIQSWIDIKTVHVQETIIKSRLPLLTNLLPHATDEKLFISRHERNFVIQIERIHNAVRQ